MKEQVIKSLETIRPMLQRDGGDVELVNINKQGVVAVRLQGACKGCPGAMMTLKGLIEKKLKKDVMGVSSVVAV